MKKTIFYISIFIAIVLLINVVKILITDFERLTEYGLGYLVGKIILLFIFLTAAYLTRKHINHNDAKTK